MTCKIARVSYTFGKKLENEKNGAEVGSNIAQQKENWE